VEDYLECIFELEESGVPPMRARLVERLGVSAPSVSETVARLEREGLVSLDDSRVIRLTPQGQHAATAVMRRHRLAERLLVDVLKVPWHQVHEEAHRLEHAISDNLEVHLVALLGDPGTCPHGNPIPGSSNAVDPGPLTPLAGLGGRRATVRRIDEEVEAHPDLMLRLEQAALMPGRWVELVGVGEAHTTVTTEAGETQLPGWVAEKVYASLD
jgi:DtxR family Mn-dependent transcriptional regulator